MITRQYAARGRASVAFRQVPPNPLELFGARLVFWLPGEDFTAASWADVTGNLTLAQATGANQLSASAAFNGQSSARSDGSDDYMVGDMTTPFASGSRPWIAMLMRLESDPGSGSKTIFALTSVAAGVALANYALATNSSVRKLRCTLTKAGPATYTFQGPAADLVPHACEISWPNATTGKHIVDGVAYNTLSSGTADSAGLLDAAGRIEIANNSAFTVGSNVIYRDLIGVVDQPSAAELSKIRAWMGQRTRMSA